MNIVLILLMVISIPLNGLDPVEKERWLVKKSSNLSISGNSNISSFTCQLKGTNRTDTLTIDYDEKDGDITFLKKQIKIHTTFADCGNPLVTSDFKKTLRSEEYPDVLLNFLNLQRPQFHDFSAMTVHGTVEIIIASVSRKYDVTYKLTPYPTGQIDLVGSQSIKLGDFDLTPPSRLMGLLKVEEEILVDFNLQLTPIL